MKLFKIFLLMVCASSVNVALADNILMVDKPFSWGFKQDFVRASDTNGCTKVGSTHLPADELYVGHRNDGTGPYCFIRDHKTNREFYKKYPGLKGKLNKSYFAQMMR